MRLSRTLQNDVPLALAIGNFDGVHRGHQAILGATVAAARAGGLTPAALSFHPLPREYFARQQNAAAPAPARLMSVTEKLIRLRLTGIERVFVPRFGRQFAAQSPLDFLDSLLAAKVKWLMVGEDFRFGAKRAGDVALLRTFGDRAGMEVRTMAEVKISGTGDQRISSSAIRQALAAGNLPLAAQMMGRRYSIMGRVTHGKKLGRTLNFPTANVALSGRTPALGGVFAVQCRLLTRGLEGVAGDVGVILNGVANLGTNPVVSSENRQHLEVFLFDFSGDLYGQRVQVTFIEKIRIERNFASADALTALVSQMHDDSARAKEILSRVGDDGHRNEGLQSHS